MFLAFAIVRATVGVLIPSGALGRPLAILALVALAALLMLRMDGTRGVLRLSLATAVATVLTELAVGATFWVEVTALTRLLGQGGYSAFVGHPAAGLVTALYSSLELVGMVALVGGTSRRRVAAIPLKVENR